MALNALVCFVKAPIKGKVKTRLAKRIGDEKAIEVYEGFLKHLLSLSLPLFCERFIAYDPLDASLALPPYLEEEKLFFQEGEDLGERMCHAFLYLFAQGYKKVILVGSDIPQMSEKIIEEAFATLSHKDAILSPTHDGGYYLIGFNAKTFTKEAFVGMTYSHSNVYKETQNRLKALLLGEGTTLRDVDTLEDLKALYPSYKTKHISVIIPVYYEDETLLKTIETLYAHANGDDFEVIVVDTQETTTPCALHVNTLRTGCAPKGRASQMNEGASMAQGEILLFLHADTHLPKQWDKKLLGCEAGAFSLSFASKKPLFRLLAFFANARSRMTRVPYGDQGQFFKASLFHTLGGYANIALMEDIEIMKRLRAHGIHVCLLDTCVTTSTRRWEKEGFFYTTLRNRIVSFLYRCGVSAEKLKTYYPSSKV